MSSMWSGLIRRYLISTTDIKALCCASCTMFLICHLFMVEAMADTVALWLFDDPPGTSVAVDSSGHNYHLSLGPDAGIVPGGKYGHALIC